MKYLKVMLIAAFLATAATGQTKDDFDGWWKTSSSTIAQSTSNPVVAEPQAQKATAGTYDCTPAGDVQCSSRTHRPVTPEDSKKATEKEAKLESKRANNNTGQPGKLSRILGVALKITERLSLVTACPQIYRKPVLFMNSNDLQWLQTCNENGSMFLGAYVLNH